MRAVKTAVQRYQPDPKLLDLMTTFRQMVNLSISIGLETGRTSLKSLSLASYSRLKIFGTRSQYRLCAISRAAGILRNYRNLSRKHRVRTPYCRRPGLTICYGLKIRNGELFMPGGFRVPLNKYVLRVLSEPSLTIRSVSLNVSTIGIVYSREASPVDCKGLVGVDRNLNNVTAADSPANILIHDLSKITMVKSATRRTMAQFKREDARIRHQISGKYGRIQRNKTSWLLHNASKKLVNHAGTNSLGVVLEKITGIRRLYRKGNGQVHEYRGRLNSWSFYELERQLTYKASSAGLPIVRVNAKGTSSKCSACGDQIVFSKESRTVHCSTCGTHTDRDVNAARNILSAGLRFSPEGLSGEAVKGNPTTTVIPGVDDSQPSLQREAQP